MQLLTSYKRQQKPRLEYVVESALDAGCKSIQFCWGNSTELEYFQKAETVKRLTDSYGAELVVNNRIDVALAVEADCIHIGQSDAPIHTVRSLLPSHVKIGLTIDSLEQLDSDDLRDADYIGAGVIYSTRTKIHLKEVLGLDGLQEVKLKSNMHVIAIGGIAEDNAHEVRAYGADQLAVIGAVYDSQDINKTVKRLMKSEYEI